MSGTVWTMNRMDLPDNEETWAEPERYIQPQIRSVQEQPLPLRARLSAPR